MVYIILCLVLLIMLEQCKAILRDANGINLHSLCRPHVCVDRHAHGLQNYFLLFHSIRYSMTCKVDVYFTSITNALFTTWRFYFVLQQQTRRGRGGGERRRRRKERKEEEKKKKKEKRKRRRIVLFYHEFIKAWSQWPLRTSYERFFDRYVNGQKSFVRRS